VKDLYLYNIGIPSSGAFLQVLQQKDYFSERVFIICVSWEESRWSWLSDRHFEMLLLLCK